MNHFEKEESERGYEKGPEKESEKKDYEKDYEKEYEGKTIMITGGLGFIGSNLAHELVKYNPKKIIIIDSMIKGTGFNIFNIRDIIDRVEIPNLDKRGVDIRDNYKIAELLQGVDYIFNLAGITSHVKSKEEPLRDSEINLQSHLCFLETIRKYMKYSSKPLKILFTSTRDVYGKVKQDDLPVNENMIISEVADPQGIHNHAVEHYHLWYRNFGIQSTILRLTNTYGPRHQMQTPDGFINYFIKKAINNKTIELWGGGKSLRDFNYIDDVIEALLIVMANKKTNNQIYNLGSFSNKNCGQVISIGEIAKLIIEIAGSGYFKEIPYPEDKKSIEPGHFFADITKIHNHTGWRPSIELSEGIKRTIDFYKINKEKYWT